MRGFTEDGKDGLELTTRAHTHFQETFTMLAILPAVRLFSVIGVQLIADFLFVNGYHRLA